MQTINLKTLASKFNAWQFCKKKQNHGWEQKHEEAIEEMLKALPQGSGIDSGVKFLWDKSTPEKLIFNFGFHHMDENGYYNGWTDHTLTITPSLQFGYEIKISGRNRNQIKEYLHELFSSIFTI